MLQDLEETAKEEVQVRGFKLFLAMFAAALLGAVAAVGLFRFCRPIPEEKPALPAVPEPAVVAVPGGGALQNEFAAAISRSMPAVVLITAQKRIGVVDPYFNPYDYGRRKIDYLEVPSGQGSGFFIRPEGIILTNYHVVRDQDSFWVTTHDGGEYRAKVIGVDPPTDLAVLKLEQEGNYPVLEFADPDELEIGHWAIAIGAPFSLSRTVTVGIVSNKKRSGVGVNLQESYVQTDASINPGNSGGPLLNIKGEVIGVNDFILSPSGGNIGLSFAISSEIAGKVADELIRNGHVERPWLGVVVAPLDREERQRANLRHGVVVKQLFRGSPAAGILQPGDVILKAAEREIDSPSDLQSVVFAAEPDSQLSLEILRNGRQIPIGVKIRRSPRGWFSRSADSQSGTMPVQQF